MNIISFFILRAPTTSSRLYPDGDVGVFSLFFPLLFNLTDGERGWEYSRASIISLFFPKTNITRHASQQRRLMGRLSLFLFLRAEQIGKLWPAEK